MHLYVYPISDPSVPHNPNWLRKNAIFHADVGGDGDADDKMTVASLKREVERRTGVPPERQRYHGKMGERRGKWLFDAAGGMFLGDDGVGVGVGGEGESLLERIGKEYRRGRIEYYDTIGVVLLPADGGGGASGGGAGGGSDSVREANAAEGRVVAAGRRDRSRAVEIANDEGDGDGRDDGPRPKRARPAKSEDGADGSAERPEATRADGGGDGAAGGGAAGGATAAPARADGAGGTGFASPAARGETAAGRRARAEADPPSELGRWLRSLGAGGADPGRFDAYAPAFEREFNSLGDLALAADLLPDGMRRTLEACGVRRIGDEARIAWAVGKLPRPG